jgi:hypothetical protein
MKKLCIERFNLPFTDHCNFVTRRRDAESETYLQIAASREILHTPQIFRDHPFRDPKYTIARDGAFEAFRPAIRSQQLDMREAGGIASLL